jgi:hypothetical protein
MLSGFWSALLKHLEQQPYWKAVQPFFIVLFGTVAAEFVAYQYVKSSYNLTGPMLFVGSYLSVRILAGGAGLLLLLVLFRLAPGRIDRPNPGRMLSLYREHRTSVLFHSAAVAIVASAVGYVVVATNPARASSITIRLADLPDDVRRDALAYLIYEVNRMQRQWYFEVDARPFNPAVLTSSERAICSTPDRANEPPLLCYAEGWAAAQGPLIVITSQPLSDEIYFATHRGLASVVTTADSTSIDPVTNYEYLAYMIVLQSMLIQLDAHGTSPQDVFTPGMRSSGGAFEFAPSRDLFKPAMLAPRLSPAQETLIFNRFGPDYLGVCSTLLSMDWLYAPRVRDNLAKLFNVNLSR